VLIRARTAACDGAFQALHDVEASGTDPRGRQAPSASPFPSQTHHFLSCATSSRYSTLLHIMKLFMLGSHVITLKSHATIIITHHCLEAFPTQVYFCLSFPFYQTEQQRATRSYGQSALITSPFSIFSPHLSSPTW